MLSTYIIIILIGAFILLGTTIFLYYKLRKQKENQKFNTKYNYNSTPKLIKTYTDLLADVEVRLEILGKQLEREQEKYKSLESQFQKLKSQFEQLSKDNKELKALNFELVKKNNILESQL